MEGEYDVDRFIENVLSSADNDQQPGDSAIPSAVHEHFGRLLTLCVDHEVSLPTEVTDAYDPYTWQGSWDDIIKEVDADFEAGDIPDDCLGYIS